MNGKDDTVRAAAEKTCYFPRVYPCHFYIKNSLMAYLVSLLGDGCNYDSKQG